ncbi:hypothetical protein E9840_09590 [Tissierella creatinini]|nr:hypothetical protein E9840_09590 [Tissierella creatinini]TJX60106.1 hypothetical protein E8P77_20535 [Soehngenia saccharolytica]
MWKYYLQMEVDKLKNKKWLMFIKQNGFLIFLFISVIIVATGTILIATEDLRVAKDPQEDELVILDEIKKEPKDSNVEVSKIEDTREEIQEETVESTDEEIKEVSVQDELVEVAKESLDQEEMVEEVGKSDEDIEYIDDYEDVKEVEVQSKDLKFMLPVEGSILTDYSVDKLVFSETLEEWRAHTGLDIGGKVGDRVKAPGDGVVKEIKEDDLWGITIIIDHGNGIESKLSNLGTMEMVKKGLKIKYGDYIGTIGDTADIEMTMDPHIHYEVFKDGKVIDPRSITY